MTIHNALNNPAVCTMPYQVPHSATGPPQQGLQRMQGTRDVSHPRNAAVSIRTMHANQHGHSRGVRPWVPREAANLPDRSYCYLRHCEIANANLTHAHGVRDAPAVTLYMHMASLREHGKVDRIGDPRFCGPPCVDLVSYCI